MRVRPRVGALPHACVLVRVRVAPALGAPYVCARVCECVLVRARVRARVRALPALCVVVFALVLACVQCVFVRACGCM